MKAISYRLSAISLTTLLACAATLHGQQPMTLQQAIDIAQKQGLQARAVLDAREAAR